MPVETSNEQGEPEPVFKKLVDDSVRPKFKRPSTSLNSGTAQNPKKEQESKPAADASISSEREDASKPVHVKATATAAEVVSTPSTAAEIPHAAATESSTTAEDSRKHARRLSSVSFSQEPSPKRQQQNHAVAEPQVPPLRLSAITPGLSTSTPAPTIPKPQSPSLAPQAQQVQAPLAALAAHAPTVTPTTHAPTSSTPAHTSIFESIAHAPITPTTATTPTTSTTPTAKKSLRECVKPHLDSRYELKDLEASASSGVSARKGFSLNDQNTKPSKKVVEVEEKSNQTVCTFTEGDIERTAKILLAGFVESGQTNITISGSDPKMVATLATLVASDSRLKATLTDDAKQALKNDGKDETWLKNLGLSSEPEKPKHPRP